MQVARPALLVFTIGIPLGDVEQNGNGNSVYIIAGYSQGSEGIPLKGYL